MLNNLLVGYSLPPVLTDTLPDTPPKVDIFLFKNPDKNDLYRASIHSAQAKIRRFESEGIPVRLITDDSWTNFSGNISTLFQSNNFKIIQMPLRDDLVNLVLNSDPYNLDCSSGKNTWKYPAVCEAAYRLIRPFSSQPIVIVGARGYFGRKMNKLLLEHSIHAKLIDIETPIEKIKHYDVIIACAGTPNIINRQHLRNHHIVVDMGYSPIDDIRFAGNVCIDALNIPRFITPVPRGIGPMQTAVLLERYANTLDIPMKKWKFEDLLM